MNKFDEFAKILKKYPFLEKLLLDYTEEKELPEEE